MARDRGAEEPSSGAGTRAERDRGAVFVELALALPVVMCLLLGLFTGGFALHRKIDISNAVREASRFGATLSSDQCASGCGGKNWAQLVQSIAVQRANGDLQSAGVCVALVSGPGSAPVPIDSSHTTMANGTACFVDNSPDTGRRVQVRAQHGDKIEWMFGSATVTLKASAVARFER